MREQREDLHVYAGKRTGVYSAHFLEPLSFWGGVDPLTGTITDSLHPHCGLCLANRVCLLAGTKGSTAAPGALLEWVRGEKAPAAIIVVDDELVLAVTASVLEALGGGRTLLAHFRRAPAYGVVSAWDGREVMLEPDTIALAS